MAKKKKVNEIRTEAPKVEDELLRKIRFRAMTVDSYTGVPAGICVYGYPFMHENGDFFIKDSVLRVCNEAVYTNNYGHDYAVSELFEEYGVEPDDYDYDFDKNPPYEFEITLPEDSDAEGDEITVTLSMRKGEKYRQELVYHVDKNTVQQFTGLRDYHLMEIYEGDILQLTDVDGDIIVGQVFFFAGAFRFCDKTGDEEYLDDGVAINNTYRDVRVIGNILETPELLK